MMKKTFALLAALTLALLAALKTADAQKPVLLRLKEGSGLFCSFTDQARTPKDHSLLDFVP